MRIATIKCIAIFYFMVFPCYAEESDFKPHLSSELNILYPYYVMDYKSNFNYGIGGLISYNLKSFRISTGFFYVTKKYSEKFGPTSGIEKIISEMHYFNVPVFIGIPLLKNAKEIPSLSVVTGIYFNIPKRFRSNTYYQNKNLLNTEIQASDYHSGTSFHIGTKFHKPINKIIINFELFGDYKFKLDVIDFNNSSPQGRPIYSQDRFLFGISIGFEWYYKKG